MQQSLDQGQTWADLNDPKAVSVTLGIATYQGAVADNPSDPGFIADPNFPNVPDLGTNSYDPNTIYATDGSNAVEYTKNDGTNWAAIPGLPASVTVSAIVVDPTDRDNVYVTSNAPPGGNGAPAGQAGSSTPKQHLGQYQR